MWDSIKKNLFMGLLFVAPIGITVFILVKVFYFLDKNLRKFIPLELVEIPGSGIVVSLCLLYLAGLFARTFAGRFLQGFFNSVLERLPVLRTIYKPLMNIAKIFMDAGSKRSFQRVVFVPFPSDHSKALAFVTGDLPTGEVLVFLPTAPNPTSGYVLAFPLDQVEESNMEVETALQMIVSCGATNRDR